MKICVQGLWHLGSVTAASLTSIGHEITGLDFSEATISMLKQGAPPLFEPGLESLIQAGIASGKLHFVSSEQAIPSDIELLWVTYDTPVNDDDEADVDFVIDQVVKVMPVLPIKTTVLISSQIPVGTIKKLEHIAQNICPEKELGFACSPENLRLGKALDVFLKPDRVVVGFRQERDKKRIKDMLAPITEQIEWMSVESAEMTKHAINAFLATSVVFANEIAAICEHVGADAKEVERGLKSESRIGPKAYLSPGGAFAGGTLARDVEFLKATCPANGLPNALLNAIKTSNDQHKGWARRKLNELFGSLQGRTFAVWGLTYKPGTNTLRRSSSVELCNYLLEQGAKLKVHDPAVEHLPDGWVGKVERIMEPLSGLKDVDALIVATEWPNYKAITTETLANELPPHLIVLDANRFLAHWKSFCQIQYIAVGSPLS